MRTPFSPGMLGAVQKGTLEDALDVEVLVLLLGLQREVDNLLVDRGDGPVVHGSDLELGLGVLEESMRVHQMFE